MMKIYPIRVWFFALLLACFTSLPYIIGAMSVPSGWSYTGAAAVPAGISVDYNSHLAKMWQGYGGHLDYRLFFTHESHPSLPLVQGFYLLLGWVARVLPDFALVFHLARFLLTIGMVLALWSLASRFFDDSQARWLTTLLGTVAAGWSWLLLVLMPGMTAEVAPIEFWLIDAFNPLGALFMPHFAAAIILQIVMLLTFDSWLRGSGIRPLVTLMLSLAALSIIQPYGMVLFVPLILFVTTYHIWIAKTLPFRRALGLVLPLGVHGFLTLYQYLLLNSDPVWADFTAQNQTRSPAPIYYLLGYLPFLIPALPAVLALWREKASSRWMLPILWIGLVILLLYTPLPTQRRYLLGVQTPLALLAAYGWTRILVAYFSLSRRRLLTVLYLALASVAPLGLVLINAVSLSEPYTHTAVFVTRAERAGYQWVRQQALPNSLTLTTFTEGGMGSGGKFVAQTGFSAFIGHWIETAHFREKIGQIGQFYNIDTDDLWRRDFLKAVNITYIWYDDYARTSGDWDPSSAHYLNPVFTIDDLVIYQVQLGGN